MIDPITKKLYWVVGETKTKNNNMAKILDSAKILKAFDELSFDEQVTLFKAIKASLEEKKRIAQQDLSTLELNSLKP